MRHVGWYSLPSHTTVIQENYFDEKPTVTEIEAIYCNNFNNALERIQHDMTQSKKNLLRWMGWTVKGSTKDQETCVFKKGATINFIQQTTY